MSTTASPPEQTGQHTLTQASTITDRLAVWRCRRAVPAIVRQLAIMVRAGLDLSTALATLSRGVNRPEVRRLVQTLHDQVERGISFARALEEHPHIFPPVLIASVAAAEASGSLAPAMERAATALEEERRLRSSVLGMLAYPAALVLLSIVVLTALMVFVLPRFEEIFDSAGVPLPWTTSALLACSRALTGYPLIVLAVVGAIGVGAYLLISSPRGKARLKKQLLRAPALGPVLCHLELGRLLYSLGTMLDCGVPLLEALDLAGRTSTSPDFHELTGQLKESALKGQGLAQPLRTSALVPPEVAEMAATAERTGSLAWVLQFVGKQYQEAAEARMKVLVRLAEPVLILSLGGMVAIIVASVMLPLFDLSQVAAAG